MAYEIVWENIIDQGKFHAKVIRLRPYVGELIILHIEDNVTLLRKDVGLDYDAVFGPDVSDLYAWQQSALVAIDAWYEERGQQPPY